MPPTLILHGDKDVLVNVAEAHSLDELLTAANRPHEMHIYEARITPSIFRSFRSGTTPKTRKTRGIAP